MTGLVPVTEVEVTDRETELCHVASEFGYFILVRLAPGLQRLLTAPIGRPKHPEHAHASWSHYGRTA